MREKQHFKFRNFKVVFSFSLIELLVCLAIGSVLFSLMLPAFQKAKKSSQLTECMGNLKQIGMAIELYGQDMGYYPNPASYYPFPIPNQSCFSYVLSRYLGKEGASQAAGPNSRSPLFHCPSSLKPGTNLVSTYSMNMMVGFRWGLGPDYGPMPYPYTIRPHEIIMMVDGDQMAVDEPDGGEAQYGFDTNPSNAWPFDSTTANQPVDVGDNLDWPPGMEGQIRFRHCDDTLANALFVDGHVAPQTMNGILERNVRVGE